MKIRLVLSIAACLMSVFATTASAETYQTLFPNRVADGENPAITEIFNAMDFKTGKITLPGGIATVDTGDKYYFLDQKNRPSSSKRFGAILRAAACLAWSFRSTRRRWTIPGA